MLERSRSPERSLRGPHVLVKGPVGLWSRRTDHRPGIKGDTKNLVHYNSQPKTSLNVLRLRASLVSFVIKASRSVTKSTKGSKRILSHTKLRSS
jgi:hypothetical protein